MKSANHCHYQQAAMIDLKNKFVALEKTAFGTRIGAVEKNVVMNHVDLIVVVRHSLEMMYLQYCFVKGLTDYVLKQVH